MFSCATKGKLITDLKKFTERNVKPHVKLKTGQMEGASTWGWSAQLPARVIAEVAYLLPVINLMCGFLMMSINCELVILSTCSKLIRYGTSLIKVEK